MAKELTLIEGTVANVLNKRVNEINFYGSLTEAKRTVINILSSPEIKQQDLASRDKQDDVNETPYVYSDYLPYR